MTTSTTSPILFFDGTCNLCNGYVQFIIRHDRKKRFLFAPLQSKAGKKAVENVTSFYKITPDSVILLYKGKWHTHSSAALNVLKLLGLPWSLLYAANIIPAFLRDIVYNFVARNRYKWFGKRNECMIPQPDIMNRFIS